jgi:hypothetical protein
VSGLDWRAEARRLRGQGLNNVSEIARRVGKADSTVRHELDENGERKATRERVRRGHMRKAVGGAAVSLSA